MNIEFIKWMCGKAERFRVVTITKKNVCIIDYGMIGQNVSVGSHSWKNHVKYLLLQKTLQEMIKQGRIYHDFNSLRELLLDDKKLESWLKYIYEQENK